MKYLQSIQAKRRPRRTLRPWIALAAGAAVAAPFLVHAQDSEPGRGLVPVHPGSVTRSAPAEAFDAEKWRADLTSTDLDRRQEAFERITSLARTSDEALNWLRSLAGDADQGLAWTARLAVRDVERELASDPFALFSGGIGIQEFERRLKEFTTRFAPSWSGTVDPLVVPFSGLTRPNPTFPGTVESQSKSVRIENTGGEWVVHVTEKKDGEETTREYRGKTLEEIIEANPELKEEHGISGSFFGDGFSLRIGGAEDEPFPFEELLEEFNAFGDQARAFHFWPGNEMHDPLAPPSKPLRTDVLGVVVRPVNGQGSQAGGEDHGLRVQSTAPGTIAQLLGIVPGDVILEVNGVQLKSAADLTQALAQRPEDGSVEAVWRDTQGRRRTGSWRP